ncbi:MAG: CotH kinase family protein [Chloroflexota bacterium]
MRQTHLWLLLAALVAWLFVLIADARVTAVSPPQITISPPSGHYNHTIQVRLAAPAGYTIRHRFNRQPTTHLYQGPIALPALGPTVTIVEAQLSTDDGTAVGEPVTAHYAIGWQKQLPLLSIGIEPDDFVGENGIYSQFSEKGIEWERPITLAYFSRQPSFVGRAGMRLHGNWTRTFFAKKSFRLYFRDEYGSDHWELFGDAGNRFVLHNSGQDLLVMKNSLMTELADELGLLAPKIQPVLLFLNGEPWGIYHLRERIDQSLLQRRYGNIPFDLLDTPDNAAQAQTVAGSRAHWDHLMAYVANADLSQPEALAYVETQVDLDNLIDYTLLQLYAADRDWPEFNVNQFRPHTAGGRWQSVFWDNDLSFADAERPLFSPMLEPADPATALLLRSLLQNDAFRQRLLARADVLLNTVLSAEAMTARVGKLTAVYTPAIPIEQARWEIDHMWEGQQQALLEFVQRRPEVMWGELTAVLHH